MTSQASTPGFPYRKIGAYIIAFIALSVFLIKVLIKYSLLTGVALSFTDIFVAVLPLLFAVAIMLIIHFKGVMSNIVLFIVSIALAYLIIVPVYLAGV